MPASTNLLLESLSPGDTAALQPYLKPVYLGQKTVLFDVGDEVRSVNNPTRALVSLVVSLSSGESVEGAMVGRDGVVGALASLDGKTSFSRAIVQLGGPAIVCTAEELKGVALQSHTMLSRLIRHEQTVYAQAQQSAACMAAHDIEARLCRWMLRARDLSGSDMLPFTQEFLGEMLGVRRNSVTVVAHTLQEAGMIKYSRGKIQILDVQGLEDASCECYAAVKGQYATMLGPPRK